MPSIILIQILGYNNRSIRVIYGRDSSMASASISIEMEG